MLSLTGIRASSYCNILLIAGSLQLAASAATAAPSPANGPGTIEFTNKDGTQTCFIDMTNRSVGYDKNRKLIGCGVRFPTNFMISGARSATKVTFYGTLETGLDCINNANPQRDLFIITLKMRKDPTSTIHFHSFNETLGAAGEGQLVDANVEATQVIRSTEGIPDGDYAKYLNCIKIESGDTQSPQSNAHKK
jgi:hypothetical protein